MDEVLFYAHNLCFKITCSNCQIPFDNYEKPGGLIARPITHQTFMRKIAFEPISFRAYILSGNRCYVMPRNTITFFDFARLGGIFKPLRGYY